MAKLEGETFLRTLLQGYYGPTEAEPIRRAMLDATYFLAPEVVSATQGLPLVRARRMTAGEARDTIVEGGDFVSDNFPPHYVFCAATDDKRHKGSTELCHIYGGKGEARDPFFYTNLANLCLVPSFLAKFADTHPPTVALLKGCSFILYGFDPRGEMRGRSIDPSLRQRIKIASPVKQGLFSSLQDREDTRFLAAKTAGYLFAEDGSINRSDPWVAAMIARQAVR
ncbi:hypothetical protein [Corallococcus terminator]|uniref:Uncharacterized protein n=1 Tax=Corallococcus terminator TaxID=2316733 RepID=A0A3A8IDA0_9BACT|nr:hypothetical protein [Corallococcus terminator]RKG75593.1 hypothetical protein D7V88_33300 [Corallococcus terminator]